MSLLALIPETAPVSDNKLNYFWTFNDVAAWTTSGSGSLDYNFDDNYGGENSVRLTNNAYNTSGVYAASPTGEIDGTPVTGYYLFSCHILVPTTFSPQNIPFKVKVFTNGVLSNTFDGILGYNTQGFEFGRWARFSQRFFSEDDDSVTFQFEIGSDNTSAMSSIFVNIAGVKLEIDDRQLGVPTVYSSPIGRVTGWREYKDALYTAGAPFSIPANTWTTIPNTGNVANGLMPSGITNFYSPVTNKLFRDGSGNMGLSSSSYTHVLLRLKLKSTVNNDVISIRLFDGTNSNYLQSKTMTVLLGVEESICIPIPVGITTNFLTNGLLPQIKSASGTLSTYDHSFEIELTHRN